MVALTYGEAHVADAGAAPKVAAKTVATAPRKAWYVRFFEAMMEARMQQAYREIRLHSRLTPYTAYDKTHPATKTDANSPVGGW
jgi:hypothetical protein